MRSRRSLEPVEDDLLPLNGNDPYAYLKNVLERMPTQPNSRIDELLPHRWAPIAA